MMRALDLFSAAAGGWSLGLHRAGFLTIAACEIVEWRRILYAENNPHVRLYEDVRDLTAARLVSDLGALPDIIVGSPPCQDISSANAKGKGVDGERSGLYFEAVRLVGDCRPRWFAFENSANLRTRGADRLIDELETLGYACEPCVVGASDIGANHLRKRSWLIGYDPGQLADARCPIPARRYPAGGRIGRTAGDEGIRAGGTVQQSVANADDGHADSEPGPTGQRAAQAQGADDLGSGPVRPDADDQRGTAFRQAGETARPVADTDEAGQPHGWLESGLRTAQLADHGRGDEPHDDGIDADRDGQPVGPVFGREMGRRAGAGGDVEEPWADWNGGFARHLRLDDGFSAWVADTRIALGSRKGTSAASLIVGAFGDAVLPQIPEAIGRAILRTEAALDMVLARDPHDNPGDQQ
ncbi:DNA cytosine methyltransferase [uncultured Celeribacter sp.]|uniref:DNA cytosine methyltransferase n=1 Tax=uncultured Celeribacter sp. TaxID=1303376 RepID=UPI002AA8D74E|nr:DNA cytosine methyltransferase [uncultured Celeribacter sp.]